MDEGIKSGQPLITPRKQVKRLRKNIIMPVVALIVLMFLMIIYFIKNSEVKQDNKKDIATSVVVAPPNTNWYGEPKSKIAYAREVKTDNVPVKNETNKTPETVNTNPPTTPAVSDEARQEKEKIQSAMAATIDSNALLAKDGAIQAANTSNNSKSSQPSSDSGGIGREDSNMQSEKRQFNQEHSQPSSQILSTQVQNPITRYELLMGGVIPAVLEKGINSDLPGQVTGRVTRDIYDTRTHKYLLIPNGSQLVGVYDSAIAYGQSRVMVAWKRVNFPNGKTLDIQGMPGADQEGYAGFNDKVNNHYFRIFGSVALMTMLSAGAQLSQPQQVNAFAAPTVGQTIGQSLGTNIATTGVMLTQKNLSIQPTIEIRPGYIFQVSITKDILFDKPYN